LFDAFRRTVYDPGVSYVYEGFLSVDVFPSPKSHDQDVGFPVDWSIKVTVSGLVPLLGDAVNSETGAGISETVMYPVLIVASMPPSLVTLSLTV